MAVASDIPSGATGIKVWATRDGYGTGVTLRVELTTGPAGEGMWLNGGGWQSSESVIVGRKTTHQSSSGLSREHPKTEEAYADIVRSVDEAVRLRLTRPS